MMISIVRTNYYRAEPDVPGAVLSEDQMAEPLRVDAAFISDRWKSLVMFPEFKDGQDGSRWGGRPSFDVWKAFCVNLLAATGPSDPSLSDWYTFDVDAEGKAVRWRLNEYVGAAIR